MSKFFKGVKKLFIIEEPLEVQPKTDTIESRDSAKQPLISAQPKPGLISDAPDPRFIDVLTQAMEDQNLKGVDYFEFRQSLQSLDKMPMEEQIKFHSAFAMAQSMGATYESLVQSAKYYLQVLDDENKKFNQIFQKQHQEQVASREVLIQETTKTIDDLKQEVADILEKIEQKEQEILKIKEELVQAKNRMETAEQHFETAYQYLYSAILSDLEKMEKYLPKKA